VIWADLTEQVLAQRVAILAFQALGQSYVNGWKPEDFLACISCDGCDLTLDLRAGTPDLSGWTTSGDLRNGFVDHCPGCSA